MPDNKAGQASQGEHTGKISFDEIQRLQVMHRVGPHSVWGLLEHCPLVMLQPLETLLRVDQANQTMFLILGGQLGIYLESSDEELVAVLSQGETVGELSVINDRTASATVIALTEARLLAVDEGTFWRLVEASHEFSTNMLLLLARRLRKTNSSVADSVRQRRQSEQVARIDGLTGLSNRRWLDEILPRVVDRHRRDGKPCCVLMIDIDHFKRVNDSFGHQTGDRVLEITARILLEHLRPTDLIARYGGEEFTVILPETSLTGARIAAERLRESIAHGKIHTHDGLQLPPVTISVGIGELQDGLNAGDIISKADSALYEAKKDGRNCVKW